MITYAVLGALYVLFCLWQSSRDKELQPKDAEESVYYCLMIGVAFLLWPLWVFCDLYFWYKD